MEEVKLFGFWPSPFSQRVIWALKLKGVSYEYIDEDLYNKSNLLLHYNPVHKKIPVLVHGGKPVAESMVILEYIDETWPENPLLPKDAYERSVVRFWAKFIDEKYNPVHKKVPVLVHGGKPICESMIIVQYIEETWPHNPLLPNDPYERTMARFWVKFAEDMSPILGKFFGTTGEEYEKSKTNILEMLKAMEEHGLGEEKFFGGDRIGLADIAFGGFAPWFGVMEDVEGVKLIEAHKFPRLHSWIENFKEVPIIKDNLPDHNDMLHLFKDLRKMLLASTSH